MLRHCMRGRTATLHDVIPRAPVSVTACCKVQTTPENGCIREKSGRRSDRCKHAMIRANRQEFLLLRRNFQVLTSAVSSKGRGVHRLTRAKNGTPTQRLYKFDKMLSPPYTACLANRVWFLCVISKSCAPRPRPAGGDTNFCSTLPMQIDG